MSDASIINLPRVGRPARREKAAVIRLPKPQPFAAPVFIHDAVTPLVGETVLSLLMKKMAKDDEDQP